MPNNELLTVKEAAQLLGVQPQTLRYKLRRKQIESQINQAGRHRIPRREIDRLLEAAAGRTEVSRQIIEMYQSGMSSEEIGEKLGMDRCNVRYRLIAAGIPRRARTIRRLKRERISKQRLEKLYLDDQLSISKIATELSVGKQMIEQTLRFHQIPERPPIKKGGYIVDRLRRLQVGEKDTVTLIKPRDQGSFGKTAKNLGIKVSVKKVTVYEFEITRIA